MFEVLYGVYNNYQDVTPMVACLVDANKTVSLPRGDPERASLFGDPVPCVLKHLRVTLRGDTRVYLDSESCVLNLEDIDLSGMPSELPSTSVRDKIKDITDPVQKLEMIHSTLKFAKGNIRDEYPEQLMAVRYIPPTARVLELGSNIGRNTLTIASLLEDERNLVTMESDPVSCQGLELNRMINGMHFRIESAALSYRKLIQQGWTTIPSETVLPGYKEVQCKTFQEVQAAHNIVFDTIVADCEGALYWILLDYPDLFKNINLLIQENDYTDINHKRTVDAIAHLSGLRRVFSDAGGFGPCFNFFYEVWQRPSSSSSSSTSESN